MRFKQIALAMAFIVGVSLAPAQPATAQTASRVVGSITAISGRTLTIQPATGAPASIGVSDTARILRTEPGARKLAGSIPIAFTDLEVGDRVLAVVNAGTATTIIAMKHEDIAQRQAAEAAAWHSGAGGVVKTVNVATQTVTIASGTRPLTIHLTPTTIVRRYSADSAEFAKAKPSTLDQIHPGDQLRVRGNRSADGAEITADAIVAGTFRNIAGTVLSTNPAENTVTVNDLRTKKPIVITVNAESQLHNLPTTMAQKLAARLKGMGAHREQAAQPHGARQNAASGGGQGSGAQRGGDLSRMLEQTPTVALSDLHKGEAVLIVATQGTPGSATAVTLLSGVEPLLRAFPSGNQSLFSASWNLNGGGAGAAGVGGGAGGGGGGEGGP